MFYLSGIFISTESAKTHVQRIIDRNKAFKIYTRWYLWNYIQGLKPLFWGFIESLTTVA